MGGSYRSKFAARPAPSEAPSPTREFRLLMDRTGLRREGDHGGAGLQHPAPSHLLEQRLGGVAVPLLSRTGIEIAPQSEHRRHQRGPREGQDHPERRQMDVVAERYE